MAKHNRSETAQGAVNESANGTFPTEYLCEEGKWEYVESHLGSHKLQTSGKRPPVVIGRDILQPTDENGKFLRATPSNPNGFRYWQRRVVPVMQDGQTVDEYLADLERFDAASELVFTDQYYVQGKTRFHIKDGARQRKPYKVMVDAKGQQLTREQYHKLMLESAITLSVQKHLQIIMRNKADELYDELGVDRPVAGQRGRAATPQREVESGDEMEGMES